LNELQSNSVKNYLKLNLEYDSIYFFESLTFNFWKIFETLFSIAYNLDVIGLLTFPLRNVGSKLDKELVEGK